MRHWRQLEDKDYRRVPRNNEKAKFVCNYNNCFYLNNYGCKYSCTTKNRLTIHESWCLYPTKHKCAEHNLDFKNRNQYNVHYQQVQHDDVIVHKRVDYEFHEIQKQHAPELTVPSTSHEFFL